MIDVATLARRAHQILPEAEIAGLPNRIRDKVRDNYNLVDGRRILVTTDRISAFDHPLAVAPFKGQVLNRIARHWFEQTASICPKHVFAYPDPNVVVCRRLEILPMEIVVRGYLAGTTSTSILTRYRAGAREIYGHRLPDGLKPNEALSESIITPTTKAAHGGHEEPLSAAAILELGLLPPEQWCTVSEAALALFAHGQRLAAERDLILADTKYEFGLDADGRIVLVDETHTPDSSRYWFAASYAERFAAGAPPESFDKDFVRNWVARAATVSRSDPGDPVRDRAGGGGRLHPRLRDHYRRSFRPARPGRGAAGARSAQPGDLPGGLNRPLT